MADSYIRNSLYKDASGDFCVQIDAKIYFEDKENFFLTSQFGHRWRTQPSNFTQGDEHTQKWIERIHSFCDKILGTMGLRRGELEFLTFTTSWTPWGQAQEFLPDLEEDDGNAMGSYRTFQIEMITDKKVLPRNRLPF